MSFLDSSSLSFWESVSEFGFVMVIVGVVGEGAELVVKWRKRRREESILEKESPWMLPIETAFFALLVLGLAVEFIGSHKAMRIAREESNRLAVIAANANKLAEETHLMSVRLEATNLVLRSNVAALEASVHWRSIPEEKRREFTAMLAESVKGVVLVSAYENGTIEAEFFAKDIREMLESAGFNTGPTIRKIQGIVRAHEELRLEIQDQKKQPLFLNDLVNALLKIGFKVNSSLSERFQVINTSQGGTAIEQQGYSKDNPVEI